MPVASSPSLLLAPQAWPALLLPGRSLFALSHRPPSRLHTALHRRAAAHDRRCAGGPLRAAAVEVRRHRRWRQAAESSGVCMRAAGATCEPGSGRPRWRPPEAARDLRPHGVLRRRLVAAEVCRLQALPRVTALLTAPLLAPQAGWPCQHAVLALPGPRRLDGSFAGRQESGQSAASPRTACSRSHGALTHGVRAAQRVALPPRLRPLLLRPRLVPTDRRFVARPSRFRSRKGHWATARACTGEVRGQLLPLARSRPGKLVDACLASTSGVMCSVR